MIYYIIGSFALGVLVGVSTMLVVLGLCHAASNADKRAGYDKDN